MSARATIVATGPIEAVAVDLLAPFGQIVIAENGSAKHLLPLMADAIGMIVRGDGVANSEVIQAAHSLKVIGRSGVGYDQVDIRSASEKGIPVVYVPGAGARAVAEASLAMMLALAKDLFYWDRQLKEGNWKSRYESKPGDLTGSTVGIVGFGHIGQQLAELLAPFQVTILAVDPLVSAERASQSNVELVSLSELSERSDFLSLHAPLTEETRGMINNKTLSWVKHGAYLINLARGGLIESLDVLYEALLKGRLAGVGLDVFDPEPPDVTHPIFGLPNCLTSPHSLGMTKAAMTAIFKSMAEDMAAVLSGKRPRFVVNPEVLEK